MERRDFQLIYSKYLQIAGDFDQFYPHSLLESVGVLGTRAIILNHKAGAELHEHNPRQATQKYFLNTARHLSPSQTAEVNIKSDHSHGTGK